MLLKISKIYQSLVRSSSGFILFSLAILAQRIVLLTNKGPSFDIYMFLRCNGIFELASLLSFQKHGNFDYMATTNTKFVIRKLLFYFNLVALNILPYDRF